MFSSDLITPFGRTDKPLAKIANALEDIANLQHSLALVHSQLEMMKDTDVSVTESACTSRAETSKAETSIATATETETETTITESRTQPMVQPSREIVESLITEKIDSQLKLRVDNNQSKIDEYELMLKVMAYLFLFRTSHELGASSTVSTKHWKQTFTIINLF